MINNSSFFAQSLLNGYSSCASNLLFLSYIFYFISFIKTSHSKPLVCFVFFFFLFFFLSWHCATWISVIQRWIWSIWNSISSARAASYFIYNYAYSVVTININKKNKNKICMHAPLYYKYMTRYAIGIWIR